MNIRSPVLLLIVLAGCGGGMTPVRGVVHLDGKPLAGASVTFLAQDADGRDARGFTDAQGVFRLSTFETNDGARRGSYKVVVQPPAPRLAGPAAATPLEAQQAASGPDNAAILIPARYTQPDLTILRVDVPASGDVVVDLQSK